MSNDVLLSAARRIIRKYVMKHLLPYEVSEKIMADIEMSFRAMPIKLIVSDYGGPNGIHLNYGFFLSLEMKIAFYCKYHH